MRELFSGRILRNAAQLAGERGLQLLLSLAVGVYVIRYLGPERYGLLSYVLGFVGVAAPLATLGYTTVVVRELVRRPDRTGAVLGSALGLNLAGGLLVLLGVNALAHLRLEPGVAWLVSLASLGVLFKPTAVYDAYFQSVVRVRYPVAARSGGQLLTAAARLLGCWLGAGVLWFVGAPLLGALLAGGLLYYYFRRRGGGAREQWNFDRAEARHIGLASLPLLATNAFNVVNLRVDTLIVRELLGDAATGVYAAAATLSEAWYFLPGTLLTALFPLLVRHQRDEAAGYRRALVTLCGGFFYLAVAIALFVYFTADVLVPLLVGRAYAESAAVFRIHVWAGVFVFLGRPATKALIIEDLTRHYLIIRVVAAALNVAANYALIPAYGVRGAAWATLLSYACAHVLGLALFAPTRRMLAIQLAGITGPLRYLYRKLQSL